MTTIKNTLIYFATIVSVGSFAHADIANPDFREGRPMKFTIIGHTGQDPAPKRDESTWDGPGFSDPTWFDGYVEKEPLPTKDTLFSIIYEEKPVNTTDYLKVPHHLSNEFVFSIKAFL